MNRIVNTHFTGDNLSKINGNNLDYDQESEIFDGLDRFMEKRKFIRDANDENEMKMVRALIQIEAHVDSDEKTFQFLEDIDSTLVYHNEIKKMSKREILCVFMNTICSWSIIFKNDVDIEIDEQIYKLFELYSDFKQFVNDELGLSKRRILDYQSFKQHIKRHTLVKPRGSRFEGVKLTAESAVGLPHKKVF